MMNANNNYGLEEAGMAQMDDSVGALLKHVEDIGEADNTIDIFTTDNAEVFTWPDGGMTPFKATKGTIYEGGFRVPAIAGRARSSQGLSKTESSPASIGYRRLPPPPAIPTSKTSF
jgi:arylsulfatase A-like enzyme